MAMFAVVIPILGEITEMGRNEDGNDIVMVYNKPLLIVQQRNPVSALSCMCSEYPLFYVSQYVVFRLALYGSERGLLFYIYYVFVPKYEGCSKRIAYCVVARYPSGKWKK